MYECVCTGVGGGWMGLIHSPRKEMRIMGENTDSLEHLYTGCYFPRFFIEPGLLCRLTLTDFVLIFVSYFIYCIRNCGNICTLWP